jgi:hypothetical protein
MAFDSSVGATIGIGIGDDDDDDDEGKGGRVAAAADFVPSLAAAAAASLAIDEETSGSIAGAMAVDATDAVGTLATRSSDGDDVGATTAHAAVVVVVDRNWRWLARSRNLRSLAVE